MKWPAFLRFGRKADHYLEAFNDLFGRNLAKSGAPVNWDTALKVSTVLACARVKAQGLAQVPLKIYEKSGNSRLPALEHPLYFLLHNKPNQWQTSYEYRETIGLHLDLAGRHYSFINRLGDHIVELIPLEPGFVRASRSEAGDITYTVTAPNGRQQEYPEHAIWHVRGMSWNGWEGMDPTALAREAIGLAIAAEEQHASRFANGINPTGIYSVEGALSKEQYKQLRQFIVENNTGANAGLPMIVDRGATWLPQSWSGVDAQHLETRRFQVEEICRGKGVLPIMIGHADKTITYASAEQMFIAHVVHTLTPLYVRVEQSIDAYLIGEEDVRSGYYAKFVAAGLLRGAMADRADYLSKALGAGGSPAWMTQDEAREVEELNPMGGDAAKLPAHNAQAALGASPTSPGKQGSTP